MTPLCKSYCLRALRDLLRAASQVFSIFSQVCVFLLGSYSSFRSATHIPWLPLISTEIDLGHMSLLSTVHGTTFFTSILGVAFPSSTISQIWIDLLRPTHFSLGIWL
eukprot:Gb_00688 [translate_table: standard]